MHNFTHIELNYAWIEWSWKNSWWSTSIGILSYSSVINLIICNQIIPDLTVTLKYQARLWIPKLCAKQSIFLTATAIKESTKAIAYWTQLVMWLTPVQAGECGGRLQVSARNSSSPWPITGSTSGKAFTLHHRHSLSILENLPPSTNKGIHIFGQ